MFDEKDRGKKTKGHAKEEISERCGGGGGCGSGHSMGCVVAITQSNTPFGLCVLDCVGLM